LFLLAEGLSALAARLKPREAAAVCGQAAASLCQALSRTTDSNGLLYLAQGLSALTARLGPREAAAVCGQAAASLSRALTRTTDPDALGQLAQGVSAVAARLEPRKAAEAAAALCLARTRTTDPSALEQGLSAVLLRADPSRLKHGGLGVAGAFGRLSSPESVLAAAALLQPALEPLPPPLPAQTLVDLLKHPFCVGEARRLVLEQLARHSQRPFADQWDFVRFAQQEKPNLDLTTPPARPERAPPGAPATLPKPRGP
jgi:hypothetical protein